MARRTAAELTPAGPVGMLDRAFGLAREGGWPVVAPAWAGGALLAAVVLGAYYVERVEGIHSARPLFALGLVLAWWGRAMLLGRSARRVVRSLWDHPLEPEAGRAVDVLRTSLVFGLGAWLWSWLLVAGSLAGAVGVLLVAPLFALRGLFAPSWIARAACTSQAGFRGLFRALGDHTGRRASGLLTEAMMLAGAAGLTVNLYAATFVGVLLGRSFVGLEVTAVETFLSPRNTFVQLTVAAVALVALEPLRAALSACAFVDARVRAEGLDLRAAIDDAIRHGRGPSEAGATAASAARAALVALAVVAVPSVAVAQAPPPAFPPPPADGEPATLPPPARPESPASLPAAPSLPADPAPLPTIEVEPRDRAVQGRVERILERREFREFEDHRGEGLRDLVERLFRWLFERPEEVPRFERPSLGNLSLPGPWVFLAVGALLLLAVGVYLFVTRRRTRQEVSRAQEAATAGGDPRERAPSSFLDDAARLAESGDLRAALRALYLATLVALDRRRLIAFDPHRTNWQYLRQMPRGAVRDAFRQFTRLFDHKWYGREETTRHDYERCRTLASEIVDDAREAA
ncbi:MAG TPA: DUF4129 domain-containing protein [Sandaracinaceae bacterium LLY-WYZ-13_1]|nr:DUF4129 domain-containing protein [Sandaracinaceae bacterium LLY-WYZ-13_1]